MNTFPRTLHEPMQTSPWYRPARATRPGKGDQHMKTIDNTTEEKPMASSRNVAKNAGPLFLAGTMPALPPSYLAAEEKTNGENRIDAHTTPLAFVRNHPVTTFFVIAFLIGYVAALALVLTKITAFGLIAASGSTLGGYVTAILYGKKEIKRLFAIQSQFRFGGWSYLAALVLPPTLVVGAILVNMLFGHPFPVSAVENWKLILPMFFLFLIQGEEVGWRGFALPHLVKQTRPLTAALIIGGVWACLQLPLYFFPGFIQYDIAQTSGFVVAFALYSTFVVAASVIFSWLSLRSRNSLVPAIIAHGMLDVCVWYFQYQNTHAYGGLTMLIALSLLWVVAAVLISVTSPIFRTQSAALFRRRLSQPSIREVAEHAQI
jgi:uncharacterized protein